MLTRAVVDDADGQAVGVRVPIDAEDFGHDASRIPPGERLARIDLEPQRRQLHLAVATAVEEVCANDLDEHHATLAAHYEQAREWMRAIDALRRASMVTAARGAFREAAALLEHALTLMPHLPLDADRLGREVDARIELWD